MHRRFLVTLGLAAVALLAAVSAQAATLTPVMTGLDSPRGLDLGPDGALYVAEAGRGGAGPCVVLRGEPQCYGPSGAISRLWRGRQDRVVTGLPSTISPRGEVTGPHDVEIPLFGINHGFVSVGFGSDPAHRALFGTAGTGFGKVHLFTAWGRTTPVADIAAAETSNPAGGPVDSNPYGIELDFSSLYAADAGGNTIVEAKVFGDSKAIAVLPARPTAPNDTVPTEVVRGPDGALYVSELTGVPFPAGAASIYRIDGNGARSVYAGGFTAIIDFAFARDGSLYVLQFASGPFLSGTGVLIHVAKNGTRTTITNALIAPTSVAIGRQDELYVTNFGPAPGIGQVLRVDL